ncbi:hypothetical protein B0J17DRAFT_668183, partial [Rhizoctonia solani]
NSDGVSQVFHIHYGHLQDLFSFYGLDDWLRENNVSATRDAGLIRTIFSKYLTSCLG